MTGEGGERLQLLHARVVDEEISSLSEGFAGFAQKN